MRGTLSSTGSVRSSRRNAPSPPRRSAARPGQGAAPRSRSGEDVALGIGDQIGHLQRLHRPGAAARCRAELHAAFVAAPIHVVVGPRVVPGQRAYAPSTSSAERMEARPIQHGLGLLRLQRRGWWSGQRNRRCRPRPSARSCRAGVPRTRGSPEHPVRTTPVPEEPPPDAPAAARSPLPSGGPVKGESPDAVPERGVTAR